MRYCTFFGHGDYPDTIRAELLEAIPKRFAIDFRNRWMIDRADCVIAFVTHNFGSAAQYLKKVQKKKRDVIFLPPR